ncbi:MAG TPA: dolichyl-phosphate-mannose--protein mannosyltransferase [Persephonella sp.]|uniref:Putative membrane protein n=1 Tax=Persephonella marina (strain DSM 14350 / EX-H1) TaxID=123214 RepID=C0QU70_PERMH|nr:MULTISPECIES: glycosyltransferase family 39 protein [Persephonella]ACO03217.1 putative membrane protein [Persephonella marina EX-H1]HCB70149.1 dolichyl-phosphate-mannose--protein mannosyltransferase [Persephonella sp.]
MFKINLLSDKYILSLIILGVLSLFPNINVYEFRGEESLRVIVSYEMVKSGNFLQPTFLGDLYFNKPPLFNWFIAISSFLIPWSELTARIVTIIFLSLTLLLIYRFSYKIFSDKITALFSSLIYLTFTDILFWYGYLAEIDVTLAFFIFLMIYFQYFGFIENRKDYILLSGVVAGLSFLLKGFPALVFFGITYFALIIFTRRFKEFLNPFLYISAGISILIPALWILNTADPERYIQKLFLESIVRTRGGSDILKFLTHLVEYPLLNIKQLIPGVIFAFIVIFLHFRKKLSIVLPENIKLLLFIVALNYIPYILAVESRGRYVIPLFPVLAVVFGYILVKAQKEKLLRAFVYTALFFITVRFLLGFIGFPILMEKKASRKKVAYDIIQEVDISKNIACDCSPEKSVCLYIDFEKGEPLKKSKYMKNWDYLIDCSGNKKGNLLKVYDLKGKKIYLYEKR